MNRQMTIGLVGLMCGVVVIAGFCGVASALDRRFELDTRPCR
jgi:hypothetical protein